MTERIPGVNTSAKDFLELSGRAIVVSLGVSYVFGLFIVNYHLGLYGVRSAGLLRSDYILAGATWLFLLLLTGLLWRDLLREITRKDTALAARVASFALRFPIYAVLIAFTFSAIASPTFQLDSRESLRAMLVIGFSPLLLAYPVTVVVAIFRLLLRLDTQKKEPPIFAILLIFVVLVLVLAMYSAAVYPLVSTAYGGGSPVPVEVKLTQSAGADTQAYLRRVTGASGKDKDTYLVAETADWLVFVAQPLPSFDRRLRDSVRIRRNDIATLSLQSGR